MAGRALAGALILAVLAGPNPGEAVQIVGPPISNTQEKLDVFGVRYQRFGTSGAKHILLGLPDLSDNNNEHGKYSWSPVEDGSVRHLIAFTWDPVNDKLITVVEPADSTSRHHGKSGKGPKATTLEFTDLRARVAGRFGRSVDEVNVLSVVVRSETPGASVALNDITVNGQLLGNVALSGFNTFNLLGLDFTSGFTVTATLVLTGAFHGQLNDPHVEILAGITGCEADADCDDGLACNGAETCDPMTLRCALGTPVACTGACDTGACINPDGFCEQIPGCPTTTTTTTITTSTTTTTSTSTTTSSTATTSPTTTSTSPTTTSTSTTASSTTTTSSTSTTTSSTTVTTFPPPVPCDAACGNGVRDAACGEVCDGADLGGATCPPDRPMGTPVCMPACHRIDYTPCIRAPPVEICGNCFDDDGNGLTDFEDPACCPFRFDSSVTSGRLVSDKVASSVNLCSIVNGVADQLPFELDEVYIQLRQPGGDELLCARIPAGDFVAVPGGFAFRDPKHSLETARGIDQIVARTRMGATVTGTFGKRAQFVQPPPGAVDVTLGVFSRGMGPASGACSTTRVEFVAGRDDSLVYPDDAAAHTCRRPGGSQRSTCRPTRRNRAVTIPLAGH